MTSSPRSGQPRRMDGSRRQATPIGSPRGRSAPRRPGPPRWLRSGQKVTITFNGLEPNGAAVGLAGTHAITVPFGAPGESAVVEVVRGGPHPEGKIVSLLRRSPQAEVPRCRHFGVCGGCQWQHLSYESQLQYKTSAVQEALASVLAGGTDVVRPAVGADPWAYRDRLQAAVARRGDRLVAGFHVSGGDVRVINVRECPIQDAANVQALEAARATVTELDWPAFDPAARRGLVRGIIVQSAFATGEVQVVLVTTADVPNRMAAVRLLLNRIPALRSVMLSRSSRRTSDPLGRLQLLWGREYLEDEVAGLRVRRYPAAALPPNPRAMPLWIDAIASSLELEGTETVVDTACEEGFLAAALARRAARVIGIAPSHEMMRRAWETAAMNGMTSCIFYTRAPERVVAKLGARGERLGPAPGSCRVIAFSAGR